MMINIQVPVVYICAFCWVLLENVVSTGSFAKCFGTV